jgi:hypothetical protein
MDSAPPEGVPAPREALPTSYEGNAPRDLQTASFGAEDDDQRGAWMPPPDQRPVRPHGGVHPPVLRRRTQSAQHVLARYADFFGLFGGFGGYMEFFHLQDLVNEDGSAVGLFTPFDDFTDSPLPATLDAYVDYRQRAIEFIESRNRRIADYVTKNPPEPAPLWASQQFEAVLAHAEAVEQRELLEQLLGAGDRLGLYARPYVASVMFTGPGNRARMLLTASPDTGGIRMWVSADSFEQFLPDISADDARRQLGPTDENRLLDQTATQEFIAGLERLLHPSAP